MCALLLACVTRTRGRQGRRAPRPTHTAANQRHVQQTTHCVYLLTREGERRSPIRSCRPHHGDAVFGLEQALHSLHIPITCSVEELTDHALSSQRHLHGCHGTLAEETVHVRQPMLFHERVQVWTAATGHWQQVCTRVEVRQQLQLVLCLGRTGGLGQVKWGACAWLCVCPLLVAHELCLFGCSCQAQKTMDLCARMRANTLRMVAIFSQQRCVKNAQARHCANARRTRWLGFAET